MSGILGGGTPKTQTVTNTSAPPAYLEPYLKNVASSADDAYKEFIAQGYNSPFPQQRTAAATPWDTQAIANAGAGANKFINSGASGQSYDLANKITGKVANGDYLAPGNMAFDSGSYNLNDVIKANINPVLQNFSESVVPQLKSSAIDAGAYGGSKSQDLAARTARDTQSNIGNIAAQLTYNDFLNKRTLDQTDLAQRRNLISTGNSQELAAAQAGTGLFNTGLNQDLAGSQALTNTGAMDRGFTQNDINDAMAYYADQQQSPFAGLGEYSSLINGTAAQAGGSKTQVGTETPATNGLNTWLNGLSGLGSLGSAGVGLLNGGAAAATGLPWLASGGAAGAGSSLTALLALL